MNQTDLFGEKRISINGNPFLETIANHILELIGRNPSLLDGGKMGDINRKITLAIYFDSGLAQVLQSGSKEMFSEWFMNRKGVPTEEEIARALRYLVQHDYCRLPAGVIRQSEIDRQRIARSVKT